MGCGNSNLFSVCLGDKDVQTAADGPPIEHLPSGPHGNIEPVNGAYQANGRTQHESSFTGAFPLQLRLPAGTANNVVPNDDARGIWPPAPPTLLPMDNITPIGLGETGVGDDSTLSLPVIVHPALGDNVPVEDEDDLSRLRKKCPQFRILVIGKANAGKTTLLQKMCNTTEEPIINNRDGVVLGPEIIQPTDGRGIHDINNELTFSSNKGFVFHDSPGFEAGSLRELKDVREFIVQR